MLGFSHGLICVRPEHLLWGHLATCLSVRSLSLSHVVSTKPTLIILVYSSGPEKANQVGNINFPETVECMFWASCVVKMPRW